VGISTGTGSIADLLQIMLLTRAFGLAGYGRFALIVAVVTVVAQFFDVRTTTATTPFAAQTIRSDLRASAGIFQLSYIVDGLTGLLAFFVVIGMAPFVGPHLAPAHGTQLMTLCALALLAGTVDDTSITIMRLFNRFRLAAVCGTASDVARVALVWAVLEVSKSLALVFAALVACSAFRALLNLIAARKAYREASSGMSLFRPALAEVRGRLKEMGSMLFHTNIAAYSRLVMTQVPTILIGLIVNSTGVGIYKVGMTVAAAIGRLADPAQSAIFPRIARLWTAGRLEETRQLIWRGTIIAGLAMGAAFAVAVTFREQIVDLITGGAYVGSIGAVVILGCLGQALNGVFFWNAQFLFAAHRARAVGGILLMGAITQLGLLFALVPAFEAKGAALSFLIVQFVINAGLTWVAVRLLCGEGGGSFQGATRDRADPPAEVVAPR
jgi:O-antigen/teichoic acid export membrane protein